MSATPPLTTEVRNGLPRAAQRAPVVFSDAAAGMPSTTTYAEEKDGLPISGCEGVPQLTCSLEGDGAPALTTSPPSSSSCIPHRLDSVTRLSSVVEQQQERVQLLQRALLASTRHVVRLAELPVSEYLHSVMAVTESEAPCHSPLMAPSLPFSSVSLNEAPNTVTNTDSSGPYISAPDALCQLPERTALSSAAVEEVRHILRVLRQEKDVNQYWNSRTDPAKGSSTGGLSSDLLEFVKRASSCMDMYEEVQSPPVDVDAGQARVAAPLALLPIVVVDITAPCTDAGSSTSRRDGKPFRTPPQTSSAADSDATLTATRCVELECCRKETDELRRKLDAKTRALTQLEDEKEELHRTCAELQRKLDHIWEEVEEHNTKKDTERSESDKELRRLRILLRFSELKKDSDQLPDTYAQLDKATKECNRLRRQNNMHLVKLKELVESLESIGDQAKVAMSAASLSAAEHARWKRVWERCHQMKGPVSAESQTPPENTAVTTGPTIAQPTPRLRDPPSAKESLQAMPSQSRRSSQCDSWTSWTGGKGGRPAAEVVATSFINTVRTRPPRPASSLGQDGRGRTGTSFQGEDPFDTVGGYLALSRPHVSVGGNLKGSRPAAGRRGSILVTRDDAERLAAGVGRSDPTTVQSSAQGSVLPPRALPPSRKEGVAEGVHHSALRVYSRPSHGRSASVLGTSRKPWSRDQYL